MTTETEPKLSETLFEGFQRGDLHRTIRRDFRELKQFMLTEERQKRLESMGWFKRWLYFYWWLFKSLLLKLTPARRILLAVALLFLLLQDNFNIGGGDVRISFHFTPVSIFLLLFVLMLELKDKLLAKEELEAGRAVQNALMPPRSPDVPGWRLWLFTRSANEVGGDLVDFIKISDTRFGISVGDVAGKGLRAALMAAKLQATLRALATDGSSLKSFFAKLNRIFCRDCLPNMFASLVYVELQANSGTIRLVNAGHLPPIIIRGTRAEEMKKGGTALGLLSTAAFTESTLSLRRNDILLVYSDGFIEARNEAGEFFGEQRLLDLLPRVAVSSTDELGERIVAELDRFVGEARAADDLSMVIMKKV